MKTKPPKRRVLTAREKLMRKRYTRLVRWTPVAYDVYLAVGSESFALSGGFTDRKTAQLNQNMLAISLSKIEL